MKLTNPELLNELRKFYRHEWNHREIKLYLLNHYHLDVSKRTLKRWKKLLNDPAWSGPQRPTPPSPAIKVTEEMVFRIVTLREKTGWGRQILKHIFKYPLSESTYRRIIKANGLSRGSKIENKRIHWVKWQRKHPDSLWQMDAMQLEDGTWLLHIIDDCSRYCLGIRKCRTMTTKGVTQYLESLFAIHGKPREILTDNGSETGGTSRLSQFDEWCQGLGIKHIRSRPHKPTTAGKVERFHLTLQQEIRYCKGDYELFRYRYNHIRPHQSLYMQTPAQVYFDLQRRLREEEKEENKKWG